jgi:hypothetical protein
MKRLLFAVALIAATAVPALADPTNDLKNAMLNLAKATSYHMEADIKGKTVDVDMMPPGKLHMTMGSSMEMIKIDSDMYLKMGGSWRKFNIPGMDQMTQMFTSRIESASHPASDMTVVDLGPKVVDGVPLHGYNVKSKAGDKEFGSTMYVDGGGMLVRIETPDNGVIRISKFNQPIAIVAPI